MSVGETHRVPHALSGEADHMFLCLLVLLIVMGVPASVFAQFVGRGNYVDVAKGTKLCLNDALKQSNGGRNPGKVFWRVTSNMRANGTQSVTAVILERMYDRKSGDTTTTEVSINRDYAAFFKQDPEHQGMLMMLSPQDGKVEAIVEVCNTDQILPTDSQ
ncbi:MAG TPA: hypothetical protein VIU63_05525 [Nitrospira sp.]